MEERPPYVVYTLVAVVILLIDYLTQRCCCSKSGNKISKLIFFGIRTAMDFEEKPPPFFFVLISFFVFFLVSARDFSRWTYSKSIGGCSVFSGLNRLNFFREIQFWWGIELLARTVVVKIATKMPKMTWAVPFCPYCS